ncbi:FK506-binding nuclear protein-like [Ipomoea triloba]|uniref:FK506-binding nuclear protein-like n=1 Tax=Ipomoea triloba TaxID=35885 RepID=UPI00125E7239|nr:FK506-binding nuclear protein-like [Ipomoea triloba]
MENKILAMMEELKQGMANMKDEMRQEWKQDFRQEMATIRQDVSNLRQENHASLRHLETQVTQNSKALAERPQGALPSTTVNNPRERVQAVTLQSGKELPEPTLKKSTNSKSPVEEEVVEEVLEDDKDKENSVTKKRSEEEAPVLEENLIHERENQIRVQVQEESDDDVEIVWEEEKLCGDTIELACDDNNVLESFTFGDESLSNELTNDLHEICDDDDVNVDASLSDLNDVEIVNFLDNCVDDALYIHEFLGEVEEEKDGCGRDVFLSSEKEEEKESMLMEKETVEGKEKIEKEERENEKQEIMVEGVENENVKEEVEDKKKTRDEKLKEFINARHLRAYLKERVDGAKGLVPVQVCRNEGLNAASGYGR